ncbi:MAG: hypothetical protein NDI67_15000 [Sulfuritalea sp.]|nr:hypothetical protein [Sulfuritalea sp.]
MQETLGTDRNDRNGFAQPSSIDPQSGRRLHHHPTLHSLLRSRRTFVAPMRGATLPLANAGVQGDPQHGAGCRI